MLCANPASTWYGLRSRERLVSMRYDPYVRMEQDRSDCYICGTSRVAVSGFVTYLPRSNTVAFLCSDECVGMYVIQLGGDRTRPIYKLGLDRQTGGKYIVGIEVNGFML